MTVNIEKALFARLNALVLSPVLPIAWPNKSFDKPADQKYLRAVFVPNTANRVLIGSAEPHQLLGLLQVSVYWTKNDGEIAARAIADAVAAHFSCDLRLTFGAQRVRITKQPDVRDMIVEDAAIQIPVMIAWEAWA